MKRATILLVAIGACAPTREVTSELPTITAMLAGATPFTTALTVRDTRLPPRADGDVSIGSVSFHALDVASVQGSLDRGAVLYRNVAPKTDAMWIARPNGIEELRILREGAAPRARWAFDATVRVDNGRILVGGLRSEPLFAVDAIGERRDVTVRATDAHTVEATFDAKGLTYPIVLDPLWLTAPSMSVTRSQHRAVKLTNSDVLIIGRETPMAELWDNKIESFIALTNTNKRGESAVVAYAGNKALIAGGGGDGSTLSTAEIFDGTLRTFTAALSMASPRRAMAMVLLPSGDILAMGGSGIGLTGPSVTTVESFSPTTGAWTLKASMKVARSAPGAVLLTSGKVLVSGGRDGATEHSTSELYDPTSDAWSMAGPMPSPNYLHPVVSLPLNRALTVDGTKSALFDGATSKWTATTPIEVGTDAAIAVLLNGAVLATGGSNVGTRSSAELFDPASSTWTKITPMAAGRLNHAVTTLDDGRALISGGQGAGPLSSAELFVPAANGETCSIPGECATGNCVDGVCCGTACAGPCDACNVTKGKCSAVTGLPVGLWTCAFYKLCIVGVCDATCKLDLDCAPGSYCDGGTSCQKRKALGSKCTRPRECDGKRSAAAIRLRNDRRRASFRFDVGRIFG